MTNKKISPRKYAKMVKDGMDDLMEEKRKRAPHLHTASFKASALSALRKVSVGKSVQKKGLGIANTEETSIRLTGYGSAEITKSKTVLVKPLKQTVNKISK